MNRRSQEVLEGAEGLRRPERYTHTSLSEQGSSGGEGKERERWEEAPWAPHGVQLGHLHTKILFSLTPRGDS